MLFILKKVINPSRTLCNFVNNSAGSYGVRCCKKCKCIKYTQSFTKFGLFLFCLNKKNQPVFINKKDVVFYQEKAMSYTSRTCLEFFSPIIKQLTCLKHN